MFSKLGALASTDATCKSEESDLNNILAAGKKNWQQGFAVIRKVGEGEQL